MTDLDKSSWNTYEPSRCVCIDTRIGTINTRGGAKPVFIIELMDVATERIIVKFFNVNKTAKGNCTVKHNSDFAKLYRTTTGDNPTSRYSKAKQLLPHLEGHKFIAEYTEDSTEKGTHYFKATKVIPENPVVKDEWFESGVLRPKKRTVKKKPRSANKSVINEKPFGNGQEKNGKETGNRLEMEKAVEADSNLGSVAISIPQQHLKHDIEPLHHIEPFSDSLEPYATMMKQLSEKGRIYQYTPYPHETQEQYHDRVIDESFK